MNVPMNMAVLALMFAIAAVFLGVLGYGLIHDSPLLLAALAIFGARAFTPWHRWK